MRRLTLGIVVFGLVALCGIVLSRRLHVETLPVARPERRVADVEAVKSDLCRLGLAEKTSFDTTGRYPVEDRRLPIAARWPYQYQIYVPASERFVIIASNYGPLGERPPALLIDTSMTVCALTCRLPRKTWALDNPPEKLGDAALFEYDCGECR